MFLNILLGAKITLVNWWWVEFLWNS